MTDRIAAHYSDSAGLAEIIANALRSAGKQLNDISTVDLATFDEFHIRGQKATLELAGRMKLDSNSRVLDIGSGLGGPARTLAEEFGCHVTGIDLTPEFCATATALSDWVKLGNRLDFRQGDATDLPFDDDTFDAAMTIHVAMNIPAKDKLYDEAKRVVKPGGVFAVYDVLQGEGGDVVYPVPWAREPSISALATPAEMEILLSDAGFHIVHIYDSSEESQAWFEEVRARMAQSGQPAVTWQTFLGSDFPQMAQNQVRNITERRIRTVTYICEA